MAGQQTCWQRVVKVASVGNRPCYDLTVDTPEHLYLTEAVIVHNSSILDAVNFAVWGKTRAGGIDTIVNNKGTEAKVRFTFELGGSMYRVSRVLFLGQDHRRHLRGRRRSTASLRGSPWATGLCGAPTKRSGASSV